MTDHELRQDVQSALDWEPSIETSDIAVSADDGIVTLRGDVKAFIERETAERATLRVYGVKAVANEIHVRPPGGYERSDSEIAQAVVIALKWHASVPEEHITISVRDGQVILKGTVDWQFQKDAAGWAVRTLVGVRCVTNHVAIRPRPDATDVEAQIEAAFKRSAEIDARRVSVSLQNGKVTLSGNVRSWAERLEAERAAWAAPGVCEVDDRLAVVP